MLKWEKGKRVRADKFGNPPSFSSILLDEIYRSMADGDLDPQELKPCSQTKSEKVTSSGVVNKGCNRSKVGEEEEREIITLRRACLIEKWMDQKVREKVIDQQRKKPPVFECDLDRDSVIFSSTSVSSDSSSGGLSSDTDSSRGAKSWTPSYQLDKSLKPIKTGVGLHHTASKSETFPSKEKCLVRAHGYCNNKTGSEKEPHPEETRVKLKSRASKIYDDIKKVKQPISPGGRLATFINSLFQGTHSKKQETTTPSRISTQPQIRNSWITEEPICPSASSYSRSCLSKNSKKQETTTPSRISTQPQIRNPWMTEEPICTSASSYSRSCLSKNSPSTREKLHNGGKRNVSFYPVIATLDSDRCKHRGNKILNQPPECSIGLVKFSSVSFQNQWRIRQREIAASNIVQDSSSKGRSSRAQEAAYADKFNYRNLLAQDEEDECDDALSCSSSDLFELDHLAVVDRYREELPVYETTRVGLNRAGNEFTVIAF